MSRAAERETAARTGARTRPRPSPRAPSAPRPGSPELLQRQIGMRAYREHRAPVVQPKLAAGAVNDPYERDADRAAAAILRASAADLHGPRSAPAATIQRMPSGSPVATTRTGVALPSGGGRPLSGATRAFMEPRFGADFSGVRVHEGPAAARAAGELGARAFACGGGVWLGRGAREGDRALMAHELAHVVQQGAAPARSDASTVAVTRSAPAGLVQRQAAPGGGTQVLEIPVTFEAREVAPPPGAGAGGSLVGAGMAGHVLASGDLGWLPPRQAAGRVLSPSYWSPMVPRAGQVTLDRMVNELPRDLAPYVEAELAARRAGGTRPLAFAGRSFPDVTGNARRVFTEAEVMAIPELVRRFNTAPGSLTAAELSVLRDAAAVHISGTTAGSPFASYMVPDSPAPGVGSRLYRVRVELPAAGALDVSRPNAFNQQGLLDRITNVEEAEFMVAAGERPRIVAVERAAAAESSFLMRNAGRIRWAGRVVAVAGPAVSAYRIATAAPEERAAVVGEEAGGMAGGAAGTSLAVAGCVAFGIASGGIGLFVCGLVGGVAGGVLGSAAGGALVRSAESSGRGRGECPSCHALQRQWQARGAWPPAPPTPGSLTPGEMRRLQGWLGPASAPAASGAASPAARSATGSLTPDDVARLSAWLSESEGRAATTAPSAPTPAERLRLQEWLGAGSGGGSRPALSPEEMRVLEEWIRSTGGGRR